MQTLTEILKWVGISRKTQGLSRYPHQIIRFRRSYTWKGAFAHLSNLTRLLIRVLAINVITKQNTIFVCKTLVVYFCQSVLWALDARLKVWILNVFKSPIISSACLSPKGLLINLCFFIQGFWLIQQGFWLIRGGLWLIQRGVGLSNSSEMNTSLDSKCGIAFSKLFNNCQKTQKTRAKLALKTLGKNSTSWVVPNEASYYDNHKLRSQGKSQKCIILWCTCPFSLPK